MSSAPTGECLTATRHSGVVPSIFAKTSLARILAVPEAHALCHSVAGRAFNIDPGDVAIVTNRSDTVKRDAHRTVSLLLPYRTERHDLLKTHFETTKVHPHTHIAVVRLTADGIEGVFDALHTQYRYVLFRHKRTSSATLVRANDRSQMLDDEAVLEPWEDADFLEHRQISDLLSAALACQPDERRVEVESLCDTLLRGGFVPLSALPNPLAYMPEIGLLLRCRTARSGWHLACIYRESIIAAHVAPSETDGRMLSLQPLRGRAAADALEATNDFYRSLPELRVGSSARAKD